MIYGRLNLIFLDLMCGRQRKYETIKFLYLYFPDIL